MMTVEATAKRFYDAFSRRDGKAMAECYTTDAVFSDPVFPELHGPEIGKMWQALCGRSKDIQVSYKLTRTDTHSAWVHWDARYTFSGTGRKVHNHIDAVLTIRDGKISRHVDNFSFWNWSRQALGAPGWLLGWTPLLQNKVRKNAAKLLKT